MRRLILFLLSIPLFVFSQHNSSSVQSINIDHSHHIMIIDADRKIKDNMSFKYYFDRAWIAIDNYGEASYEAIAYFYRSIEIAPKHLIGGVYNDLANCFRGGLKSYIIADFYYSKAIENRFRAGFVYYNRSICRYMIGDFLGSETDLNISKRKGWNNDYFNLTNLLQERL